jgi:hypothetical protein
LSLPALVLGSTLHFHPVPVLHTPISRGPLLFHKQ